MNNEPNVNPFADAPNALTPGRIEEIYRMAAETMNKFSDALRRVFGDELVEADDGDNQENV